VSVDAAALAFSVATSLVTAVLFGLAPALVATRVNLVEHLKEGGRTSAGGGHPHVRAALVMAQVALSMTLLSAAGLLARSFYHVLQADRGFRVENVLTMRIALPPYRYATELARRAFFERLIGNVTVLPVVESAGVVNQLPLTGEGNIHSITIEGRQVKAAEEPVAEIRTVTPGYFNVIQVPLRAGRWLSAADHADAAAVAVINETMARRFWPGENAVGKRFREGQRTALPWVTVVGVAADSRQASLEKAITPQIFRPYAQEPLGDMVLAVRTRVEPSHAVAAILEQIRRIDPEQPVAQVKTMQEVLEESVSSRRLQTYVLGAFAVYALMLATVGLHGTIAYSVTQRTREFAVRTALGARREELMAMVVRQRVVLAAGGLLIGLACALALGRVLAGYLYGVAPRDPATLAVVAVLLLISAVSAAFAPAWRAAKVDPINALREG
jgi:predicted permease